MQVGDFSFIFQKARFGANQVLNLRQIWFTKQRTSIKVIRVKPNEDKKPWYKPCLLFASQTEWLVFVRKEKKELVYRPFAIVNVVLFPHYIIFPLHFVKNNRNHRNDTLAQKEVNTVFLLSRWPAKIRTVPNIISKNNSWTNFVDYSLHFIHTFM